MSSKKNTPSSASDALPPLVPRLRFPEFRNEPGWQLQRLGIALKFQAGFPFPSKGFNDSGNGLRVIRNRDLRSDESVIYFSGEFDICFVVNDGDILIGMDGDFTPTLWQRGGALLNQRVGRVLAQGTYNHRFLLYLLTNSLRDIEKATARTTVKHLSHSAVENKYELLPLYDEQQRIADCLSSLDELITAQTQKVEALKTHKKGLIQQLFPREGETQPRLRFPEFEGEWEERTLKGAADLNPGSGGLPGSFIYIDLESVEAGKLKSTNRISREGAPSRAQRRLEPGDIIFQVVRPYQRNNLLCDFAHNDVYVASTGYAQLRAKGNNRFLFHSLHTDSFVERVVAKCTGSNYPAINASDLSEILLSLPPSLLEQQRIASCLSSLDELITNESNKLDAYKTHKKGLMQGLFPKAEENNEL